MTVKSTDRKNVLLVEDNPNESRLIQRRIEEYYDPIQCTVLPTVDEAEDFLFDPPEELDDATYPPDLILLDIYLHGQSGLYLLSELKSDSFLRKIPVVVMTGSDREDEVEKSYRSGANAFISKPDSIETFNRMVGSLVNFWLKNARVPSEISGPVNGPYPQSKRSSEANDRALRVLLVEDNPADQRTIERYLQEIPGQSFTVQSVRTTKLARDRLQEGEVDLILLDYNLPEQSGMSFMGTLAGNQAEPPFPVIMLSGQGDESLASKSIRAGAMEYIAKDDLSESVLQNSIDRVMERFRKMRAGHDWERQITPLSLTDPVTGLLNWQFFMHRLDEEINRTHRYDSYFSLIALRLGDFDTIQQEYSPSVGKEYLKQISNTLTDNLRVSDITARKSDDSFWVISPGTHAHEARLFAIRLGQSIESGVSLSDHDLELSSTVYGGIHSIEPSDKNMGGLMNSHLLVERTLEALERAQNKRTMNILTLEAS